MNLEDIFPEQGQDRAAVIGELTQKKADDLPSDGSAFAFAYDAGEAVRQTAREAFVACMGINGLDPTSYPSARRLENDVVAVSLRHLRAPEGAVGTATAGGTESVMLAVKTARDHARRTRPEIHEPEMLLPETAHACFHKAAHYFGMKTVEVACDPETLRADPADAARKLTKNTILVVGSAASYAHGVIDPIGELAALASEHGVLMHVDACIGGWVLPFQRELGIEHPPFDFSVAGVTSISMDLHKYAFAPKGVSVLLQRSRELRDAQYFACATWTGYSIVNSTTLGSKSLAALGAAWALLRTVGRAGYRDMVAKMWRATTTLVKAVDGIEGLRVVGSPDMGLVALASASHDVFELADRLSAKGWHVQPTYAYGHSPAHIHLSIDPGNAARMPQFIDDLRAAMIDLPAPQEPPAAVLHLLEALVATVDGGHDDSLTPAMLMQQLGVTDGRLPSQSALIHRVLDAASPKVREKLLALFIGELFS